MIGEVLDGFMHADLISELVKLVVSSSKQRKGESVSTEFRFVAYVFQEKETERA
jgi:hypothetical protein